MTSLRYRLQNAARRRAGLPPLPAPGAPPFRSATSTGQPVRLPRGYNQRAGGWLAAPRTGIFRASPVPVERYLHPVTTDIGPDGVGAPAVFTAGGTASVSVGPAGLGATWSLDQAFVSTSVGPLDPAVCTLLVGPGQAPAADWNVATGLAGGGSQFGLGGLGASTGEFVTAQWTGGTPGAVARLRVTGTKTVLATS
jgi:hypothetical protein